MDKIKSVENVSKQSLTSKILDRKGGKIESNVLNGYYLKRLVLIEDIFDCIIIDKVPHYNYKCSDNNQFWYIDTNYKKLYKDNSLFMDLYFKNSQFPKRCEDILALLTSDFIDFLKLTRKRVSKLKVKLVVKHLLKHISRLYYHKVFTITYTRQDIHWKDSKNLSHEYMMALVDFLVEDGCVKDCRGYIDNIGNTSSKNISSMLVFKPDFINKCNGVNPPKHMDVCLEVKEDKPLIKIHIPAPTTKNKKAKKPRTITKPEKLELKPVEALLLKYRQSIRFSDITINGIGCPEMQYTVVYNEDLYHGGRIYDNGYVQSESQTIRGTIVIDGEFTVEKDYGHLHYALACDELGISISKDPYDFPCNIAVDKKEIELWKDTYRITGKYDPIRNLKKSALLVMFNAVDIDSARKGLTESIRKDHLRKDKLRKKYVGISNHDTMYIIEALLEHNKEVSSYLCSGVGSRFQNIDSKMMLYCIEKLLDIGEIALPVHDSLIVKESLGDYTEKLMEDAYEFVMGSKLNCKIK